MHVLSIQRLLTSFKGQRFAYLSLHPLTQHMTHLEYILTTIFYTLALIIPVKQGFLMLLKTIWTIHISYISLFCIHSVFNWNHTERFLYIVFHMCDTFSSPLIWCYTTNWDLFDYHGFTQIPVWIINHMPNHMRDGISYHFPNFTGCSVWISNFIPHFEKDVIDYPCLDLS